ncbi:CNH-domain-containing protein [Dendrothele bispora CBS 962.96]|uniref:CNH-domain-containing protein n=1 Tax=Dendrothele bispora (strain CBS 962.96) TaxID=1314807 RepID=A0A4S8LTT0_DENBC|nr:CNH-domain-containing protein [Dendrothele bispora CBS 962.96]
MAHPDKRNQAFESIFGRPSANHHQTQVPHIPTHYYPQDRRAWQHIPPPQQPPYPASLSPPSIISRPRSVHSVYPAAGVIVPQPEEPPDPSGLTPAQAYQAQVYLNSPSQNHIQPDWTRYSQHPQYSQSHLPPPQQPQRSHSPQPQYLPQQLQNAGPSHPGHLPQIPVNYDNSDGTLGIDFANTSMDAPGTSSDPSSEDSSELPWVRQDPTPTAPLVPPYRQQSRQPSPASSLPNRFSAASDSSSPHPLHIDTTAAQSIRSSVVSTSPSSFTMTEHASIHTDTTSTLSGRRSSESAHAHPRLPNGSRQRTSQDRSMSMSAATNSMRAVLANRPPIPSLIEGGRNSPVSIRTHTRKTPIVYPALLSRVAEAFRDRIQLTDRIKDGLTYKDAFDGREAVDKIAYIIKTTDRNLALLLGRALDAQKFFHDVTYDHRLRDSANELYQFRTKLPSPFVSGELPNVGDHINTPKIPSLPTGPAEDDGDSPPSPLVSIPPQRRERKDSIPSDEVELPSGVFTLLTDCYSPTCSRDQLCYSIACPRRLEQQARLNMKPQAVLKKQISKESLGDTPEDGTLWIHSVPPEIVNSVSDKEKRRQEAINEVIYTERDFVRDMEYLRDIWIKRLQEENVIPEDRRTSFLEQVFWNIFDIIAVNTRLRDALIKRQKQYAVVEKIGDILLDAVPHFGPFVSYGAHQLYGKYEFEKEKGSNQAFAQFVETTERLPESRKLELNAYLTKPTTRLARYPLLLEAVLKHTPDDSPDKTMLPQVISLVREFLAKVNAESGKTENRFNLIQLDQQLVFRPGEEVNLRLREEGREMIYKGTLNKRDGELHVYLFDHALLFTKLVKTKQHEQFKVYRRPIPLELLYITASDDALPQNGSGNGTLHNRSVGPIVPQVKPDSAKGQYWINFIHLGRKYYNLVLWANSALGQKKWLETIFKQQQSMRDRSTIFETVPLSEGFFSTPNKVNCAAPYYGGRKVAYGTDDGVYISDLREINKDPIKVLALQDVAQVDVLEEYQLLIVLSERSVITFPLDALDPLDPLAGLKRAKRISSHTSFFKAGHCLGRMLVCIVKSSQLSSTFKTLEPIAQDIRGQRKPTFKKLLQGGNDTLKMFREFYIPVESTSIHYLKTKLCVGCSRGFEIVDLETLDTQGLLDPNDESLEFVRKRDNLRPMAIYRIQNEFLLCYDEFAFYVNKTGRRSRKEFMVHWEGVPTGFALREPFVLAFEPSFVEIRHIETGLMTQVIQGSNLRLLFAENPPSMNNGSGYYNPYQQPGFDPYNGSQYSPYGGRFNGGYPHPAHQLQQQYGRSGPAYNRDEILMVSDDRVLALRTQRSIPDNASMVSVPR